ncbi:MAG: hypothetical protein AAF726_20060 [Planctomycetota bacterium]
MRLLSITILLLAIVGCSSPTSYQTVPLADATGSPVAPDMCRVYVARTAQTTGSARAVVFRIGGQTVGVLGESGYLCMDRPVGRVVVEALYDGPKVDQPLDGSAIGNVGQFDGEPGVTYYFRVWIDPSSKVPQTERISADEGRALIATREPAEVR